MSQGLHHCRVLVTRPLEQAQQLSALIDEAGGVAVSLPLLEIEASVDAESKQRCQFVAGYDWVIFISPNAVRYALALLPSNKWMENTAIAAIGHSTTDALRQAGFPVDVRPDEEMNSEGLLQALATKSLSGKKILIIRGVGGREALAKGLCEKQAQVDYAEVYRRVCPDVDVERLSEILQDGIDVITISSGETLRNLATMIKLSTLNETQKRQLESCTIIVVSERIKQLAKQLEFTATVIVAEQPDNAGLVKAIQQWHCGDNE